jgi:hypothetical protein
MVGLLFYIVFVSVMCLIIFKTFFFQKRVKKGKELNKYFLVWSSRSSMMLVWRCRCSSVVECLPSIHRPWVRSLINTHTQRKEKKRKKKQFCDVFATSLSTFPFLFLSLLSPQSTPHNNSLYAYLP